VKAAVATAGAEGSVRTLRLGLGTVWGKSWNLGELHWVCSVEIAPLCRQSKDATEKVLHVLQRGLGDLVLSRDFLQP
jgi:hypothetical protein